MAPLIGADGADRSRVLLDLGRIGTRDRLGLVDRTAAESATMRVDADEVDAETGVELPSLDEITVDDVTFRASVDDIGFANGKVEI